MKVFDFTNGVRGDHIGNVHCTGGGGWVVEKDGIKFQIALADNKFRAPVSGKGFDEDRAGESWAWNNQAFDENDELITPDQFGVEAICFCVGRFNSFGEIGTDEEEWTWEWFVIGSRDWNRKACKAGVLTATKAAA